MQAETSVESSPSRLAAWIPCQNTSMSVFQTDPVKPLHGSQVVKPFPNSGTCRKFLHRIGQAKHPTCFFRCLSRYAGPAYLSLSSSQSTSSK
jgi:hypothetical protein